MVTAIVLAAGIGSRMQSDTAKQFMKIGAHEVLFYSLNTFQKHTMVDEIVLVTKPDFIAHCKDEIIDKYGFSKVKHICAGGKERYNSVYNGLKCINKERNCEKASTEDESCDIVMIHDGARPFVTEEMITQSVLCAKTCGACTVGVPAKDTIKIVDDDRYGEKTPERSRVYQIQTPQTFKMDLLLTAYEKMFCETENQIGEHKITDDTMLVEQYSGVRCKVVDGTYKNIKITTPEDLEIACIFAQKSL